jgi:hypothetical protein
MSGSRGLRVLAFLSIAIGIGILSRPAWGFVVFGILVLGDTFLIKEPPRPPVDRIVVREPEAVDVR